jgi:hypothetical protein
LPILSTIAPPVGDNGRIVDIDGVGPLRLVLVVVKHLSAGSTEDLDKGVVLPPCRIEVGARRIVPPRRIGPGKGPPRALYQHLA